MNLKTKMEKVINKSYGNIGGIVVLKNGETVYENYFNDCNPDSTLHVFSVTKSIISTLIGVAINQGYIESVDRKVLDFFPDYKVQQGENKIQNIAIRDLLTMTAPYKYNPRFFTGYSKYFKSQDWVLASLDLLGGKGKIGDFLYTPLIGPDILSGILTKATGKSVLEFATETLFTPLEIEKKSNVTFKSKEEQMAFNQTRDRNGWVADPKGINTAGWGLTLTAKEMAKIGQLYLAGGVWNCKQLVPANWIKESTIPHSGSKKMRLTYGYLWWIIDEKERAYAAMGDGGNVIYVNEQKELVISIASIFKPRAKDSIKLIREYIEPVFAS